MCLFYISVCEYYAHLDCQDFVVSDCKECATYGPQKDLVRVKIINYLSREVRKPVLRGFRPGPTQTGLYSHRRWLETWNFGFRKQRYCTIQVAKTKLISVFVFATCKKNVFLTSWLTWSQVLCKQCRPRSDWSRSSVFAISFASFRRTALKFDIFVWILGTLQQRFLASQNLGTLRYQTLYFLLLSQFTIFNK